MKRLVIILLCLFGLNTISGYADDFNSAQIKLRNEIKTFLQEEGFMPEIDSDGDIAFKKEGDKYYVIIDEGDTSPMYVTLSKYFSYGDRYNKQTIAANLETLNLKKAVKTVLFDNSYVLQAEMYLVESDSFKYVFYKLMKQLAALEDDLDEICSNSSSYSGSGSRSGSYGSSSSLLVNEEFSSYSSAWKLDDGDLSFKNGKMIFKDVEDYGYSKATYDLPRNLLHEDFEINMSIKIKFNEDYSSIGFIIGKKFDDSYRFGMTKWSEKMALAFGTYGNSTKYCDYSTDAGLIHSSTHSYRMVKRGSRVEWYADGLLVFSTSIDLSTDMTMMGFLLSDYNQIEVDHISVKLL